MLSIMGERERTQEYGNEIHCHVYTLAKFEENTTILSYIHVQYTIDTMNIQYQKYMYVCTRTMVEVEKLL